MLVRIRSESLLGLVAASVGKDDKNGSVSGDLFHEKHLQNKKN